MKNNRLMKYGIAVITLFCFALFSPSNTFAGQEGEGGWTDINILVQPSDVVECEESVDHYMFIIAAPGNKDYEVVYRWWKDGKPYSDYKENFGQLNFEALEYSMSGVYMCEVFAFDPNYYEYESMEGNNGIENELGNQYKNSSVQEDHFDYEAARVSEKVFSSPANLYVLQKPEFMEDIPTQYATEGEDLVFTFEAHTYGEHNIDDPSYYTEIQWFKDDVAMTDNQRIEGAQASILTVRDVQADDYSDNYQVRLVGECDTVWSNTFAISEKPSINIATQPQSQSGCNDDVVQFTAEGEASVSGFVVNYQWMVDGEAIEDEAGKYSGATTSDLDVTISEDLGLDGSEEFTCQIWPQGFPENAVETDPAMLDMLTAPEIATDLEDEYTVDEGEEITLTVEVDGDELTYSWEHDGTPITENTNSYTITDAADTDAGDYTVTVSNECGQIVSNTATVNVEDGPISPTSVIAGIEAEGLNAHPNPFKNNSTVSFMTDTDSQVRIVLYNIFGNEIATLYNSVANAGNSIQVEIDPNEYNLSAGTYFISMMNNGEVTTKQIKFIK